MSNDKKLLRNLLQRKGNQRLNGAVGGLGLPSKMPGYAYGISALKCVTGAKLVNVPGSVCEGCYALGGNYAYPSVMGAHERRLASMSDLDKWADNMIALLTALADDVPPSQRYFRFHDSGDLQSVAHLEAIYRIAGQCQEWQFWLPTREYAMVRGTLKGRPRNLLVRLSGHMVGQPANVTGHTSTVDWATDTPGLDFQCPALTQDNHCGDCRACWDPGVANVNYKLH